MPKASYAHRFWVCLSYRNSDTRKLAIEARFVAGKGASPSTGPKDAVQVLAGLVSRKKQLAAATADSSNVAFQSRDSNDDVVVRLSFVRAGNGSNRSVKTDYSRPLIQAATPLVP